MGMGEPLSSHTPRLCAIPMVASESVTSEIALGYSVSVSTAVIGIRVYSYIINPGNSTASSGWLPGSAYIGTSRSS